MKTSYTMWAIAIDGHLTSIEFDRMRHRLVAKVEDKFGESWSHLKSLGYRAVKVEMIPKP